MSNFSIKVNLTKINGASLITLTGKSGKKKQGVFIPVEDAPLYIGEKGTYLNLIAFQTKEEKFNQTHFIKVSVDREAYDAMTKEEREAIPIVGNVSKIEGSGSPMEASSAAVINGESFAPADDDDLPF